MRCCKWKENADSPGDQIQAAGQNGTTKISPRNKLWSVSAVDRTGPVLKDAGEQLAGILLPSARKVKVMLEEFVVPRRGYAIGHSSQ
jgi:hypothetical protein